MNNPMQANGAEMLRIACIAATEAGIKVVAPVHDAILIEDSLEKLDDAIALSQRLMVRAGIAVTGGLPVRVDASIVKYPDRYSDPRGAAMWGRVTNLLSVIESA
jgi:hypothetical protein